MAEDYRSWSYEDLTAEIQREEDSSADLLKTLEDIVETLRSIEKTIVDEQLFWLPERFARRARTIIELGKRVAERAENIRRREERIGEREREIIRLQIFHASPITIAGVRRIVSALRGWQTRRTTQQTRELRRLERLISLQVREEPLTLRLAKLSEDFDYWSKQLTPTRSEIAVEEARLQRKKAALPKLYRVKIRLYNEMEGPRGSPTGMFQGWFDVDAILDPLTRLVKWGWWLTVEEIKTAKTHMVGYFNMAKWTTPGDMKQAYLDEMLGIPESERRLTYARKRSGETYTKGIPVQYIMRAEQMTVGELVVGESSVEPKPNPGPTAENMGVYFQQAMIIGSDGSIKWQERRNRWVWHPTDEQVTKVKEELRIATL